MTALASTSCNFDNGLCCDWQQSIADVFDWTINTGSTGSSNTGPDYDHTSGLGKKKIIYWSWWILSWVRSSFPRKIVRNNADRYFACKLLIDWSSLRDAKKNYEYVWSWTIFSFVLIHYESSIMHNACRHYPRLRTTQHCNAFVGRPFSRELDVL